MQQYNMFNQVHKGLRALLFDTAIHVQHTDFWNVEDAAVVIGRIRDVVFLFDKHAHSEDNFVFPAVKKYEPSVADLFEQEHVKDHELGEALASALTAYEAAPTLNEKVAVAPLISQSFTRFLVFNLEHMAKEEEVLNKILWRYYSAEELIGITKEIIAHLPPPVLEKMNSWMLRGLNVPEITGWFRQVEATAPEFIYQALLGAAEEVLSEHRFRQVVKGLNKAAVTA
jgi:hemerythrin-like domain-containing protein